MAKRIRNIQLHFMVTEQERSYIAEKMEQLGTKNLGVYDILIVVHFWQIFSWKMAHYFN